MVVMTIKISKSCFGARYFKLATLRALAKRGIQVVGSTWAPGSDGSFANGQTVCMLDDNGTQRVRSYLDTLAIADGGAL